MRPPLPATFPKAIAQLDLELPALLEASAGTGKTYAIEHLILLMVGEKNVPIEELLLLSFTEKTAGELRDRIRSCLRKAAANAEDWPKDWRDRFFEASLRCDEAPIHTLHGFCNTALRANALENGSLFDGDLADDRALLDAALNGLLRGPWAKDEAGLVRRMGAFSSWSEKSWRKKLVGLALAYRPLRGDVLEPRQDATRLPMAEAKFQEAVEAVRIAWKRLLDRTDGGISFQAHLESFGATKKGMQDRERDVFRRLGEAMDSSVPDFFKTLKGQTKAAKDGFAKCLTKTTQGDPLWIALTSGCQIALDAGRSLKKEATLEILRIAGETAASMRARLDLEKKRLGSWSYDDMVANLLSALRARPEACESLRSQYLACVVDEFQDTDSLQWELLRRLCLDGVHPIPLFLVGDPKQAIYAFRGGDLRTYLEARTWMRDAAHGGKAQGFGLTENHRSGGGLVAALNQVFADETWFGSAASAPAAGAWRLPEDSGTLLFTPATVPEKNQAIHPGPAISLADFSGIDRVGEARRKMQAWIGDLILGLTAEGTDARVTPKDAPARPPVFGDIAVLVRTNSDAEAMERRLRQMEIPCRVRRRGGILASPQADQIRLLLELLERAGDPKAWAGMLLLPFLRRPGVDWPEGLPERCPDPVETWSRLAGAGRWPELFRAVLYETGYLYRLAAETRNGSEVRMLRSAARILAEEGLRDGLSLRDLVLRFDALRRAEEDAMESVTEAAESETENRVTVMTLHLSKGLEFPFVFLAALGKGQSPDFFTLRSGSGGFRHVLDTEDPEAERLRNEETLAEEKRLFYVALTRAKMCLYIPLLPPKFKGRDAGPLGGFARVALERAEAALPIQFSRGVFHDAVKAPGPMAASKAETDIAWPPDRDAWEENKAFFMPRKRRLASYSQLAKKETWIPLEEDGKRLNREEPGPAIESLETDVPALPPGTATGNALHELLEALDFAAAASSPDPETFAGDAERQKLAARLLARQGLGEEWAGTALRLAWKALAAPLPDPAGGEAFALASVSERRHEVEFLFPVSGIAGPMPEGATLRDGFLWGFIDLVFRRNNRYYVLDWKSNFLPRYDGDSIGADMERHHYHLQYQLYSVALDKWLSARMPGYDPVRNFGGVYYLYLRGANPSASGAFSGFSTRPSTEDLRTVFPARLRAALGVQA